MKKLSTRILLLLILAVGMASCKSSRSGVAEESEYLSSKVQLTIPNKESSFTVNGTMKMKRDDRVQLSLLMPILRSEMVRLEVSPDTILVVDRMNKRFVRASRKELKGLLPKKVTFDNLEKLLYNAAKPEGKRSITGTELGIPSMDKAKLELSGFSDKPFTLTPTQLSQKYQEVTLEEILQMLNKNQ